MAVAPLPSRDAEERILAAYREALARIRVDAERLAERQRSAIAHGERVSPSWLYQQRRFRALEQTTLREMARFETVIERQTRRAQANVIPIGARDAGRDVASYAPTREALVRVNQQWGRFDPRDVERLVGNTADGRPLGELLRGFSVAARDRVTNALVVGIVSGHGPRKTAAAVRAALDVDAARALTIARTETLRVYRESRIDSMRQSRVVEEWTWVSVLGPRTCPMCYAMHGSVHPVTEPFGSHPNCRCAPVAKTISWAALGIDAPDTSPYIEPGPRVFARLPAAEKTRILGPGGHDLYQRGVPLERFAARTHGPYGLGLRRVPNRDLAQLVAKRRFDAVTHPKPAHR